MNCSADSAVNHQQPAAAAAAVVAANGDPPSSTTENEQLLYASVRKFDRGHQPQTADNCGGCDAEAKAGDVTYTEVTRPIEDQSSDSGPQHPRHGSDYGNLVTTHYALGVLTVIRFRFVIACDHQMRREIFVDSARNPTHTKFRS